MNQSFDQTRVLRGLVSGFLGRSLARLYELKFVAFVAEEVEVVGQVVEVVEVKLPLRVAVVFSSGTCHKRRSDRDRPEFGHPHESSQVFESSGQKHQRFFSEDCCL